MSATLFLLLVLGGLLVVPAAAAIVRRGLPQRRRALVRVEPVGFGFSQKARRSPRHAVLLHRGLMGSFFMALVALSLLPAATAFVDVGLSLLPTAIAFGLPTLVVALHARRRSHDG